MTILGIDPGTRVTGYAVIRETPPTIVDCGCIRPPVDRSIYDRYLIIYQSLEALIVEHQPDALAVESQFFAQRTNPQSILKLGIAKGMVMLAASKKGIPIYEYTPTEAKCSAVGKGSASKQQVQQMIGYLFGCKKPPMDAADAIAIAMCHMHRKLKKIR
jgi:crossover junction endodeoxyribonuclease RuvC